jgi:hypothetical protein
MREESVMLENGSGGPVIRREVIHFLPPDEHLSLLGFIKPGDAPQDSRFATATGAQQGGKFPRSEVISKILDCHDPTFSLSKTFGYML